FCRGSCMASLKFCPQSLGQRCRNFNSRRICCSRAGEVLTNKDRSICTKSTNPSDWWQKYK
ncbi:MAG: hypothetical protein LKM45_05135, partial [Wolbachia endosymbiont of Alcedoecus sp.]|nr:hypothetical protein [Wolbachia endosymbiont of Alcedoecus sp.]